MKPYAEYQPKGKVKAGAIQSPPTKMDANSKDETLS
jgi:hypothetical protein